MLMMKKVGGVCDSHTFRRANTHSVHYLSRYSVCAVTLTDESRYETVVRIQHRFKRRN